MLGTFLFGLYFFFSKYFTVKLTDNNTIDYSRCAKSIKSKQLMNLRSEKIFINIYNETISVFQTSSIESNDTSDKKTEDFINNK